jgi:7-cyano-7-deazaguanine synthase
MHNPCGAFTLLTRDRAKVHVLASGGIDSTALIDFCLRQKNEVECVHFQYGQQNAQSEKKAFEKVIEFYGVKGAVINLGFLMNKRGEEILGRNALFVLIASFSVQNPSRIALGVHVGTRYYDCTTSFTNDCQRILDGYFAGTVRLETPFINFSKSEIISYCKSFNVPLDLTYSCQKQNHPPCGQCSSCLDRKKFLGD